MAQNTITKEDREILEFAATDLNCTVSELIETLKYNCVLEALADQRTFLKEKHEEEALKPKYTFCKPPEFVLTQVPVVKHKFIADSIQKIENSAQLRTTFNWIKP